MTVNRSISSNPARRSRSISRMRGFSLLELMVTLAVLAALAFTASAYLQPAVDTAREPVAQYGMREVAAAILRFHQDTGFWPRTGPYETASYSPANSSCPPAASYSPANLCQLFFFPTSLGEAWKWNPDTRRGWHGPYLTSLTSPLVKIGTTYPASATGEGASVPTGLAIPVTGVGDGFVSRPVGEFLKWVDPRDTTRTVPGRGQPLLFFAPGAATPSAGLTELGNEGCNTTTNPATGATTNAPCLISLGADGVYGTNSSTGKNDDEVFNF
jgi:prepilin-type N-terminal cleavage/methylation domain-containing protein